ncbi:MAG: rhomboid family intramembrane serine protease [Gemmatimonadota bacterium]|nr:rhomboid family intramembrane serine protease [Gemmatimonadota bacterium]
MTFSASHEPDHPHVTPAVRWIVLLAVGVALVQATVVTPADMAGWLGFRPSGLSHAWWSVFSYAFVQTGTWPLVATLFALLVFGPHVEQAWGTKTFTVFFLWNVAGGAVVHAMVSRAGILTGAAAGVFGVMLAYGWLFPRDEMYVFGVLPMRAWTLIGLLTGLILALGFSEPGAGGMGYLAHLGGFAFALLYLKRPNPVNIDDLRHRVAPAPDPTNDAPRAIPRTLPRSRRSEEVDEIVAQSKAAVAKRPARTSRASGSRDQKREALNRVLDKISQQGLDSLSPEERVLLEEISRRLRGRGR